MAIDTGTDKEVMVHIYDRILLSQRREWNNAICSNMGRTRDYTAKWNKSDRERQMSYDIIWNLKYDTNELIYKLEADSQT